MPSRTSKHKMGKSYPAEIREKAVRLVNECGYTIAQAAAHLECSPESVRRWRDATKSQLDPHIAQRMENEESELKRLRKENKQLQTEVEILKKATAYFAKDVM